jgi:D-alanine transaminase/branched-chain amino acid aminotransferase
VLEGIPVFAEDHIERLDNSMQIMDFNTGLSKEDWLSLFYKMIKANGVDRGGFRVVVTGGFSDDGYTIPEKKNIYLMLHGLPASDPAQYEHGVSVLTYAYQRDIPDAKTTVYIESMKAQPRLKEAGAFEILYHWNGDIKECSRCNIFFIDKNGGIHTPSRGMLKGITRKQVLAIAEENNLKLTERDVHLSELPDMAGAFLTATTKGVLPVVKIDDKPVGNGLVHPVARQLQELYLKKVDDYLANAHLTHK